MNPFLELIKQHTDGLERHLEAVLSGKTTELSGVIENAKAIVGIATGLQLTVRAMARDEVDVPGLDIGPMPDVRVYAQPATWGPDQQARLGRWDALHREGIRLWLVDGDMTHLNVRAVTEVKL